MVTRSQNFYSYMSNEPDDFQSAVVPTTASWLAGNWLGYFLAAILSLCGKLGCAVWKLLEMALDKLSLLTASHHFCFHEDFQSSQLSMLNLKQHLCWLPVITVVPMMTSSHHNSICPRWSNIHAECQSSLGLLFLCPMMTSSHHHCSRDDFQSSPLLPWWLSVITTQSVHVEATSVLTVSHPYRFHVPWWLPANTIVPMMTSSHHYCSHESWWLPVITINCSHWSNTCADCQSSLLFPWWLPVITIVPMMTSSYHNSVHIEATKIINVTRSPKMSLKSFLGESEVWFKISFCTVFWWNWCKNYCPTPKTYQDMPA